MKGALASFAKSSLGKILNITAKEILSTDGMTPPGFPLGTNTTTSSP
jgi:hypothetical protein